MREETRARVSPVVGVIVMAFSIESGWLVIATPFDYEHHESGFLSRSKDNYVFTNRLHNPKELGFGRCFQDIILVCNCPADSNCDTFMNSTRYHILPF